MAIATDIGYDTTGKSTGNGDVDHDIISEVWARFMTNGSNK